MGFFRKARRMLEAGEHIPESSLRDFEGKQRDLKILASGGPVLLAFFKTTCPVCQFTFPFLQRIHEQNGKIRVVGISQDDVRATREFNNRYGVSFPTLLDPAKEGYLTSNAFGISHVPTLFLVEPDGRIASATEGFSRADLAGIGERAGAPPFRPGEYVPEWRSG